MPDWRRRECLASGVGPDSGSDRCGPASARTPGEGSRSSPEDAVADGGIREAAEWSAGEFLAPDSDRYTQAVARACPIRGRAGEAAGVCRPDPTGGGGWSGQREADAVAV